MDVLTKLRRLGRRYERAGAERDAAIREAAKAGHSRREIARAVGLSPTRVHQIIKEQPRP